MALYSTILDLAGLENDSPYVESLKPYLTDKNFKSNKPVFSTIKGGDNIHTMVRLGDLKLMKVYVDNKEVYELYNLNDDPTEINNIWPIDCKKFRSRGTQKQSR